MENTFKGQKFYRKSRIDSTYKRVGEMERMRRRNRMCKKEMQNKNGCFWWMETGIEIWKLQTQVIRNEQSTFCLRLKWYIGSWTYEQKIEKKDDDCKKVVLREKLTSVRNSRFHIAQMFKKRRIAMRSYLSYWCNQSIRFTRKWKRSNHRLFLYISKITIIIKRNNSF